jgi:hypothetical protein
MKKLRTLLTVIGMMVALVSPTASLVTMAAPAPQAETVSAPCIVRWSNMVHNVVWYGGTVGIPDRRTPDRYERSMT